MANATLLSWINAEVDQALKLVRDNIAKFSGKPEDDGDAARLPRPPAPGERGAAHGRPGRRDALLRGDRGQLLRPEQAPRNGAAIGTIDRAVLALKEFVGGPGARPGRTCRCACIPVYRELATLAGQDRSLREGAVLPRPRRCRRRRIRSRRRLPQAELRALPAGAARASSSAACSAGCASRPAAWRRCARRSTRCTRSPAQLPEPRALWWVALGLVEGMRRVAGRRLAGRRQAAVQQDRLPDARPRRRRRARCNDGAAARRAVRASPSASR